MSSSDAVTGSSDEDVPPLQPATEQLQQDVVEPRPALNRPLTRQSLESPTSHGPHGVEPTAPRHKLGPLARPGPPAEIGEPKESAQSPRSLLGVEGSPYMNEPLPRELFSAAPDAPPPAPDAEQMLKWPPPSPQATTMEPNVAHDEQEGNLLEVSTLATRNASETAALREAMTRGAAQMSGLQDSLATLIAAVAALTPVRIEPQDLGGYPNPP